MILDDHYRELNAVSNSAIKYFLRYGPKLYYDRFIDPSRTDPPEVSTESTDIGDLVDCYLTTPELFDKYYYISGDVKCSPDVKAILNKTWQKVSVVHSDDPHAKREWLINIEDVMGVVIETAREHISIDPETGQEKKGYRNKYGDDALAKYFKEVGKSYYEDLGTAGNRKILDMSTDVIAKETMQQLLDNDITGKILSMKSTGEAFVVYKQNMLQVTINGMECKALLDFCAVDHKLRSVYVADIKTSTSHQQFQINYRQHMYGNQAAFYTGMLKAVYPGYNIIPFEFIVGCTQSGEDPMVYRMDPQELAIYTNGAVLKNGMTIPGWRATLDLIKWHTEQDLWRYPKECYDAGYITLKSYTAEAVDISGIDKDVDLF